MLTDGTQNNIGAAATVNVFLGRPIEFIGVPSVMRLLAVSDLIGMSAQLLINVGGDQRAPIASGQPLGLANPVGGGPKDDEDNVAVGVPIPAGARLQFNVTNPGAAANMRWRAYLLP